MTDGGRGRKGRGGSRRGGGLQCTRRTHGRRNERTTDSIFWLEIPPGGRSEVTAAAETEGGARSRGATASDRTVRAGACHYRRRRRSESVSFRGVCCDGVFRVEPACNSCNRNCGKCLHMPSKVTHERAHQRMRIFVKAHPL